MNYIKFTLLIVCILLLTVLTQTGGVILLICVPVFSILNRRIQHSFKRFLANTTAFLLIYLLFTFTLVPVLAAKFGRVPLPVQISKRNVVQPLNLLTCLLNRHYVRPQLKETVIAVAKQLNKTYPESKICYLDAGFPFINGFPMIPHLSHNDGKKLDLAFLYKDRTSGENINGEAPSWTGYGVCELPLPGEVDMPSDCAEKGYWQYSFLKRIIPEPAQKTMTLDEKRTKSLLQLLARQPSIGMIFLEPHLKARMHLQAYSKIRFHGCQAVRHDDHIHIQLD